MVISGRPAMAFRHVLFSSLVALSAFAMAFVSGYLFGRADGGSAPSPIASLVRPLERATAAPKAAAADDILTAEERQRFRVFWETWGVLENDFYNRGALDRQKMIYGATKGMVEALNDPYTVYLTPVNREISDSDLRGSFDGIGIHVDMREGKLTVVAPIEGSPADQAGLRPDDVVTHVDSQSLNGKTLNDTVLLIRGQRGTPVTLTVIRARADDPLTFTIVRAEIKTESVRSKMLDEGVGYLRISNFGASTSAEATASLRTLLGSQPRAVIIDLRSNPGGYLHSAVEVASQFMNDGVVLYQANGKGDKEPYPVKAGGMATDTKLAVLVNKGTASASEILAAALRDNGRAVIIGEKTFGKGTVQNVHELSDHSGLRVTSAQWLTPLEQPLQGVGITPDIQTAQPADAPAGTDPQLDAAVRYLLGG